MTLTRDVEMEFVSGTWTSVFSDIRTAEGLTAFWGQSNSGPTDRTAESGTLSFSLDNSQANSAGTMGYYAPDHASVRSGFAIGTPVRIKVSNGTATNYKKYYITSIRPHPGKNLDRATEITAMDFMAKVSDQLATGISVQTVKRADEALTTLCALCPVPPENVEYDTGPDTFAYLFHDIDSRKNTLLNVGQRVVQSDLGYLVADMSSITIPSTTDITDSAGRLWTLTAGGSITTTTPAFGAGCLTNSGASAYSITTADSSDFAFAGDFAIAVKYKPGSVPTSDTPFTIASQFADAANQIGLTLTPSGGVQYFGLYAAGGTGTINFSVTSSDLAPSSDSYALYEIDRSGNNFHFFFNGTQIGATQVSSDTMPDVGAVFRVGGGMTGGLLDEFLVINRALHTSAFTPPAAAYVSDSDTVALLHFDNGTGEVLKYQSRHNRLVNTSIVTLNDNMNGLDLIRTNQNIYNDVTVVAYPVDLSSSETSDAETLYSLQREVALNPGASEYTFRYRDPNAQGNTIHLSPGTQITPTSDEYRVGYVSGTSSDGATSDVTIAANWYSDYANLTFTNTNANTVYLNFLELKGQSIRLYDPAEINAQDDTSDINAYGYRPLRLALPYQDNPNTAKDFADHLLSKWSNPVSNVESVEFVAKTTVLETAMLAGYLGEKVTITETATGINTNFYINGIEWKFEPTLTRCKWYLERSTGGEFWFLGVTGMSELGVTTILGF